MPTAPPLSQFNVNAPMVNGISQTPTGVALTSVGNNELLSNQLGNLMRSDNPLVQNAQQNARAFAAASLIRRHRLGTGEWFPCCIPFFPPAFPPAASRG